LSNCNRFLCGRKSWTVPGLPFERANDKQNGGSKTYPAKPAQNIRGFLKGMIPT